MNAMRYSHRYGGRGLCALALFLCTQVGSAEEHFVNISGTAPFAPYTNWITAATTIQDAVDSADDGDVVWVTNGIYAVGGRITPGALLANRVVITNTILVRSVGGPTVTTIEGSPDPGTGGLGSNAVRCVFMTAGTLSGFTLTHGHTSPSGAQNEDRSGGGVYGGSLTNCVLIENVTAWNGGGACVTLLTDCTVVSNSAVRVGGGAYNTTLVNCSIVSNAATFGGGLSGGIARGSSIDGNRALLEGGGSEGADLYDCTVSRNVSGQAGGGAVLGSLRRCIVSGNSSSEGGGTQASDLFNCLIVGNTATNRGGGTYSSVLRNCTVADNVAGLEGGGVIYSVVTNCIVYHNGAPTNANIGETSADYSCTIPDPGGSGNRTNAPLFLNRADDNYRLQSNSPAIDAGVYLPTIVNDLDIIARPLDGTNDGTNALDMGAFEFVHPSADSDNDGQSDANELVADTSLTNRYSFLGITGISATASSTEVSWHGGIRAWQFVECAPYITSAEWKIVLTNPPPTAVINTLVDFPVSNRTRFYRVRAMQ